MWNKLSLSCLFSVQLLFVMLSRNCRAHFVTVWKKPCKLRPDTNVAAGHTVFNVGSPHNHLVLWGSNQAQAVCHMYPISPWLSLLSCYPGAYVLNHLTLCALLSCLAFISARRPLPIICNPGYRLPPWGLPLPSEPSQGSSMESGVLSSSERSELLL